MAPDTPRPALRPLAPGLVRLEPGLLRRRWELNLAYVLALQTENLLQNHLMEAALWGPNGRPENIHWGWESPTSQVRGHFLGHWLSAAAHIVATTGHPEVRGRAEHVVAELARCQAENGGEWVASIPEKYLERAARGRAAWAPQYVVHKTLMGLVDMHVLAGNEQAREVLERAARWFTRWTSRFTREEMDDILDYETGGMLEVWADLYALTGADEHRVLVERYDRRRLFDRLLAGEDVLTNRHANTTIAEVLGAARAYEVTGDERWRRIVEAYWDWAVTRRGTFCTGGQTAGEVWTPPHRWASRLGPTTQEHCSVYNMMRLAERLMRWTGEACYAEYWERNLWNGILAQQHPDTGMVAYFLPLRPGSRKQWGSPTGDFWCCHGTLVQTHASHTQSLWFEDDAGIVATQLIPSAATWQRDGAGVTLTLREGARRQRPLPPPGRADLEAVEGAAHPRTFDAHIEVRCDRPLEFSLRVRIPAWTGPGAEVSVDGMRVNDRVVPGEFLTLRRRWDASTIDLRLPRTLGAVALPDRPDTVAFLDGPVVLAGLCDEERALVGDPAHPEALLIPDNEREQGVWRGGWRAVGQNAGLRFVPLHEVADEAFAVHFPLHDAAG